MTAVKKKFSEYALKTSIKVCAVVITRVRSRGQSIKFRSYLTRSERIAGVNVTAGE